MRGKIVSFLVLAGLLASTSCVRERDTDVTISQDQTMGEFLYTNAFDIIDDAATKNTGDLLSNYKTTGFCANITHDKVSNPRNIVVDFGSSDCLCNDGRRRNGKIIATYTGNAYKDASGLVNIQFENYTVDKYKVFGTIAVENKGLNNIAQPYYDMVVTGKYLNPQILDTLGWNAKRTKTHAQGSTTPVFDDDVFEYIGTGNGVNQYKVYYSTNIVKPLIKNPGCRYFTSGTVEQQPQGHALRTINYGSGDCDNDASVSFNTKSYNIKL